MAQKVQVLLVDDLDGGEADETVTFAICVFIWCLLYVEKY